MQGTSLSGQVCFYEGKLVATKDFPLQVVPDMKNNHYFKPYSCTNTEFDCLEVEIKEKWQTKNEAVTADRRPAEPAGHRMLPVQVATQFT